MRLTPVSLARFLLGLCLLFPLLPQASDYALHVLILAAVNATLALGLTTVTGFTGLLDLGYIGFFGLGAYGSALLGIEGGLSFWATLPLCAVLGALFGLARGAPTLRLSGDYFAIVTFGFSALVVLGLSNEIWLTRGPLGLAGIPGITLDLGFLTRLGLPGPVLEFETKTSLFYLAAAMTGLVWLALARLRDSRLGRSLLALREDPLAAVGCGIDPRNARAAAFGLSAAIAALAGAFFGRFSGFLSPDIFSFWESFLLLCMVVLGGLGSLAGACLGAVILTLLGELLRELMPLLGLPAETRFIFFGLLMILLMRARPVGLCGASTISVLRGRAAARLGEDGLKGNA